MQFWMLKEFVLNFGTTDLSDFFLRQFDFVKPILNELAIRLFFEWSFMKLYNPHNFLKQGYARIVDSQGVVVRSISQVNLKEILSLELEDGSMEAEVQKKSLKLN